MTLETKRLLLRPWEAGDAEELYRYAKDPRVGPPCGWAPHADLTASREVLRTVLCVPETYAVVLKTTGRPIGSVSIKPPDQSDAPASATEAEIGYWLGVPYWGQGLIPEAVEALQRHCFADLALTAIWCGYYDGNEKSKRVQEKCGFAYHHTTEPRQTLLGDMRIEHFTYLTKEEWERLYPLLSMGT